MDCSLPGSSIHGIFRARVLEWDAIAFSIPDYFKTSSKIPYEVKNGICVLRRVLLFVTSWTVAHQAPLSMGFSRQEYCGGLPFPSPGDLPDLGIEPWPAALQADSLHSAPLGLGVKCLGSHKRCWADAGLGAPVFAQISLDVESRLL